MSTLKANSYQHVDRASPSIIINSDGSVSISSTVTYEDVTSVDSVGIITARSGINVTAGISTFGDDVVFTGAAANVTWDKSTDDLIFNDNAKAIFGTSSDGLEIYHNGNNSIINDTGTGNLIIAGSVVHIKNGDSSESFAKFTNGGSAELYHNDTLRLTTTNTGVDITDNLSVAGIATISGTHVDIADSIRHVGDSDTKIRFPAANTFSVETAGSERVRVDGSGNVGIGTNSADRMLHILGTGNAIVKMEANYSGSVTGIEGVLTASGANRYVTGIYGKVVNTSGSESNVASIRLWNQQASPTTSDSPGYITFNTTNDGASTATEKLRITSAGNVGIGSLAPTGKVDIASGGNSYFKFGQDSDNPKLEIFRSTGNASNTHYGAELQLLTGDFTFSNAPGADFGSHSYTERLRIDSAGNMGLGGAPIAPGHLTFHMNNSTSSAATRFHMTTNTTGATASDGFSLSIDGSSSAVNLIQRETADMIFYTAGSARLTINSTGNAKFVGIVTTTTGQFVTPNETGSLATRNRIINGAMEVHQRGDDELTVNSSTKVYLLDRWVARSESGDAFLMDVDDSSYPPGFKRSLKINCSTASSGGANEIHTVTQNIEGNMIADFGFGNSYARDIAVSFWVKSSLTGDFGFSLQNSAQNRSYNVVYNIASADTWQYISKVIPGPTTGSWNINEMIGLRINFDLGCGSNFRGNANTWTTADDRGPSGAVSMMQTQNSVWRISGVQIEMGPAATPFEYRGYAEEFYRCQRYYQRINGHGSTSFTPSIPGLYNTLSEIVFYHRFAQPMRSAPTLGFSALNTFDLEPFDDVPNNLSARHAKADGCSMQSSGNADRTKGFATFLCLDTAGGYIEFDAEID